MVSTTVLHQILDRSDFSPRTKNKYRLIIDRWIAFAGEDPTGWTRTRVQDWYDGLVASGIKVQSANVYAASLRYVSRWYATRAGDPALDFAMVQTKRGRDVNEAPRALTREEIEALLRTCAGGSPADRRDLTMIVLGLETGMRRMSLEAIAFDSIHDGPPYPFARVPVKGPGGRGRFDVPLSDLALLALRNWQAWLVDHHHKRGKVFVRLVQPSIYTTRTAPAIGRPLSETAINHLITARARDAGIDHVHPHLLRHTFITSRTIAGFSVFEIAAITGHKVPGMGAAASYVDMTAIVEKIRNSTPPWLAALVRELL